MAEEYDEEVFDDEEDDDEDEDLELEEDLELDDLAGDDDDIADDDADAEVAADDDDEDEDLEEELETEDEAEEDEEESLDVLLARDVDEDLLRLDDEPRDGVGGAPPTIAEDEFTCQSCFLVKRRAQLANKKRMLCVDCA